MNKKAQNDLVGAVGTIIVLFIGLMFIIILAQYLSNLSCSDEKSQINDLTDKNTALNSSLKQCVNQIEQTSQECEKRIVNETKECADTLDEIKNEIRSHSFFFIIYNISFGIVLILAFHLFKIEFKIDFGHKINKFVSKYRKVWWWSKVILWMLLAIIVFAIFIALIWPFIQLIF